MEALHRYFIDNNINDEITQGVLNSFKIKHYQKGDYILNMGENTQVVSFIISGLVRGFYLDEDGVEITKCFTAENTWCCAYNMLEQETSKFWIEALEDCELAEIEVKVLKNHIDTYPELTTLLAKINFDAFVNTDIRGVNFQRMDAKERYLYFIEKFPDIFSRVKQEHIASYLGITATSLSRIKKSL